MTSPYRNDHGQPVGRPLPEWKPVSPPPGTPMIGTYCRLESLQDTHVRNLFDAYTQDADGSNWTYSPYGPFDTPASLRSWINQTRRGRDTQLYAVIDGKAGLPRGIAAYMSFKASHGTIEIGHIHYGTALQRTTAGSEAIMLMMRRAFSLGCRRVEWRCHALNERSRRSAERLGFTFEGVFRNSSVQKGHNRDTAWFSVIDEEWPAIDQTFHAWLSSPDNADGTKNVQLSELMARRTRDPKADARHE